jgi:hypothetical protein
VGPLLKKSPLLLPPAFLLIGLAAGRFFPSSPTPENGPGLVSTVIEVPAAEVRVDKPTPRSAQPHLADWQDFIQQLDRATTADLAEIWKNLPPGQDGQGDTSPGSSPRHRLVIERWTELDPAGALAFVKEKTPDDIPLAVVVFQTWAQHDPESALIALQGETDAKFKHHGIAGFLLSFRETPGKMVQWAKRFTWVDAKALDGNQFNRECPDELLRQLLAADRPGLYEIAKHLPAWFQLRLESLTFLDQASNDLSAAIASLKARNPSKEDAAGIAGSLGTLAQTQPAKAIAILDALGEIADGEKLVKEESGKKIAADLVKYLAASDPFAAAAFITRHLDTLVKYSLGDSIYHDLFAASPAAALIVAQALPPFPPEMVAIPEFKDRQSALEILPSSPSSLWRDRALQTTLDQWQKESPAAAQAWMDSLPPGEFRDRAAVILAGQNLHQNVVSLQLQEISFRSQTSPTAEQLKDVEMATNMAVRSDPAGTLAALGSWPPGPSREAAMEKAASAGAGQSTVQALAWAQQISDPTAQAEAIKGVVGVWTTHEPLAASEWLPTLTPGPVREAAVDRFAENMAELDPAASLAWAGTLTDPAARANRLESTWRKWVSSDPAAAAAALTEIPGLTPADVQQLQTLPPSTAR